MNNDTRPSQKETKSKHGFVLLGDHTVYGGHLAMFTMPEHQYQVVAQLDLGEAARKEYAAKQQANPTKTYVVVNTDEELLQTLIRNGRFKAAIVEVTGNDLDHAATIVKETTVRFSKVLHNRHLNPADSRPPKPRYLVFGSAGRAHMTHYLTKAKDYQLLADLDATPTGLTAQQLAAGVLVHLESLPENHEPESDPLGNCRGGELDAVVIGGTAVPVQGGTKIKLKIGATRWFDTKELNKTSHEAHSSAVVI